MSKRIRYPCRGGPRAESSFGENSPQEIIADQRFGRRKEGIGTRHSPADNTHSAGLGVFAPRLGAVPRDVLREKSHFRDRVKRGWFGIEQRSRIEKHVF